MKRETILEQILGSKIVIVPLFFVLAFSFGLIKGCVERIFCGPKTGEHTQQTAPNEATEK